MQGRLSCGAVSRGCSSAEGVITAGVTVVAVQQAPSAGQQDNTNTNTNTNTTTTTNGSFALITMGLFALLCTFHGGHQSA